MARKKIEPIDGDTARAIGTLLRALRRDAGFQAVREASAYPGCPAAQQTIYAYERGRLVPSLRQFMDLVEFYALDVEEVPDPERVRLRAVASMTQALLLPAYHVAEALDLIRRLQPEPNEGRRRRGKPIRAVGA
jgi:hypothetical protein